MEKEIIIGGTYRIIDKLGEGGGGVVYRGEHLRLRKPVVLKADRRSLRSHSEDKLRREVDALKNLHHTYLPQVYDFIQDRENGVVYTVIDYIEGVSLDKPLALGIRFPQKRVIRWARQLLEALVYLHTRPPHGILHADIKPANIMLVTSEDDILKENPEEEIRLIDFNIALFLKENGAVRVGYSDGYASPEHYGLDYSQLGVTRADINAETEVPNDPAQTILPTGERLTTASSGVLLDARSDIYSVGATLYHFLTGEFPNPDAISVRPISEWPDISKPLAQIIEKAMNPNPNLRYQTAKEMLEAFLRLHTDDPRRKKHRRRMILSGISTVVLFILGGMMTFTGLKRSENYQNALKNAEYSANALQEGDVDKAVAFALQALPEEYSILNPPYIAEGQRALTNALGVYELDDSYQVFLRIPLMQGSTQTGELNEPGSGRAAKASLSQDGTIAAALVNEGDSYWICLYNTETGRLMQKYSAEKSILSDYVFPDNETILFAGADGLSSYNFVQNEKLWVAKEHATGISLSADGRVVATVNRDAEEAFVYNAQTGELIREISFAGKKMRVPANDAFVDVKDSLFALSGDGHYLAVSFSDGGLRIFDTLDEAEDMEILDTSQYTHFEGGFSGSYFAMSVLGPDDSAFLIFDLNTLEQKQFFADTRPFHIQADENGILVSVGRTVTRHDPETGKETELAFTNGKDVVSFFHANQGTFVKTDDTELQWYDDSSRLRDVYSGDERVDFLSMAGDFMLTGSRDESSLQLRKMQYHPDAHFFSYDPSINHLEARVHADKETAMLFGLYGFTIINRSGEILHTGQIPDSEQIYDLQYRRSGDNEFLEVIYNDGLRRTWSAKTGDALDEKQGEVPDRETFYEEFSTQDYRVTHPHHGTPLVYNLHTGKLIGELESRDGLTYVTQTGDKLIAQYVTKELEHYAILMNGNCEALADLPDLCDILSDDTLVFDDTHGNLRQSRIHSIDELLQLATTRMEQKEDSVQ